MAAGDNPGGGSSAAPERWPPLGPALLACLGLAALSLLAPVAPAFDPWAWLVWGREIAGLELDTTGGPSWKPLPSLIAVPLSAAGDAAPELWLLIARAGWLMALVLAWRLAARLVEPEHGVAARLAAGTLAALSLLLLEDDFTPWLRQGAAGLAEPLLAALVLAAVDRELEGSRRQALAFGAVAALIRPEAWPFLAAYAAFAVRREPELRRAVVTILVAVPALWFLPDALGAGDPLEGAARAREGTGPPLGEAAEAVGRALEMLPIAIWIAAALETARAARAEQPRIVLVLALGAAAWILVVAAMAAVGYAGLPRFAAPAAALACVLGGVGLARLGAAAVARARADRAAGAAAAVGALAVAFVVQALPRAAELPGDAERAAALSEQAESALSIGERLRQDGVLGCGSIASTELLIQPPLAWALERPLSEVHYGRLQRGRGVIVLEAPPPERLRPLGPRLAREGRLAAYLRGCAAGLDRGRIS
jgi:hypothetical protein